jgi:hypothetical protein
MNQPRCVLCQECDPGGGGDGRLELREEQPHGELHEHLLSDSGAEKPLPRLSHEPHEKEVTAGLSLTLAGAGG